MRCQIFCLRLILSLFEHKTRAHEREVKDHVDLIECQPVFYKPFISCEEHGDEFLIEINEFTVLPSAVLLNQVDRAVEMCDCDKGLDSVFAALFEYIFIELKPFLVRLCLVPVREDTCPCDGETVCLESHLAEHGDILLVVMIHVDRFHGRIVMFAVRTKHLFMTQAHRETVFTVRAHVYIRKPSSAFVVSSFTLIRGCRAAP